MSLASGPVVSSFGWVAWLGGDWFSNSQLLSMISQRLLLVEGETEKIIKPM